jgi:hypothetical protein
MKYGLPATAIPYKTIEEIQRYAVEKFLSPMGYDHSTHRTLIFGPKDYGEALE